MNSILRWLHENDAHPSEIFDYSDCYRTLLENFSHQRDAFVNELTPRQIDEFEKLLDKNAAIASYEASDTFRVGFCMGARVMMEVMAFGEA